MKFKTKFVADHDEIFKTGTLMQQCHAAALRNFAKHIEENDAVEPSGSFPMVIKTRGGNITGSFSWNVEDKEN